MEENRLRSLAALLGIGTIAFGALSVLAPRAFGRLFGLAVDAEPTVPAVIRSVGVRDTVLGMSLWSAAVHGGHYAPWLLARLLSDAGDTVAVALAIRNGARAPGFLVLSGLALGASAYGAWLYRAVRSAATSRPSSSP